MTSLLINAQIYLVSDQAAILENPELSYDLWHLIQLKTR